MLFEQYMGRERLSDLSLMSVNLVTSNFVMGNINRRHRGSVLAMSNKQKSFVVAVAFRRMTLTERRKVVARKVNFLRLN